MGHTYGRRRALLKRMQRGFTMVEVIVAIGMLTLVGLAAAQFAVTEEMLKEGVKLRKGKKVFHKAVLA